MVSLFGYLAVALVVAFVLFRLWELKGVIIFLVMLAIPTYFITNYILKDADMSEENVKVKIIKVMTKTNIFLDDVNMFLKKMNSSSDDYLDEPREESDKEPEPEGFVN